LHLEVLGIKKKKSFLDTKYFNNIYISNLLISKTFKCDFLRNIHSNKKIRLEKNKKRPLK